MITIAPGRKQGIGKASQQRAFDLFTLGMSRWSPGPHHTLKSPLKQYIIEPQLGGRWSAVGEDGSTGPTGYVIDWQPPLKVVLAWQLSGDWQVDPGLVPEVDV